MDCGGGRRGNGYSRSRETGHINCGLGRGSRHIDGGIDAACRTKIGLIDLQVLDIGRAGPVAD